jgi:hypothetical protein
LKNKRETGSKQSDLQCALIVVFVVIITVNNIIVVITFFNLPPTQPLTEMSTRNLPGGKGWQTLKADNLTAICEPIV